MKNESVTASITRAGYVDDYLRLTERMRRRGSRVVGMDGTWVGTFLSPEDWARSAREYDELEARVRELIPRYNRKSNGRLPPVHPLVRKPNAVENAIWFTATQHTWVERPKDGSSPFRVVDLRVHGRCAIRDGTSPFRRRLRNGVGGGFVGTTPPRYRFPMTRRKRSDRNAQEDLA
jgi:hypothetical protein